MNMECKIWPYCEERGEFLGTGNDDDDDIVVPDYYEAAAVGLVNEVLFPRIEKDYRWMEVGR